MPKELVVKSVLNKTKHRDSWFLDEYTINLYSSCSFNCLYCYIRGSKYGTNLASSLSVKTNAIEILDKQLGNRAKKGQYGIIVVSSATDPYLQLENEYELTRQALKIIAKHRFPVHIITKSNLVIRDFDILEEINKTAILPDDLKSKLPGGTIISFSFSTLDNKVGKIFEPGATPPTIRQEALAKSVAAKFLTGVSMMPLIPFVSDTAANLKVLFGTFKRMGVNYVLPATITLYGDGPASSKTLMFKAIRKHYPALEQKYIKFFKNGSEMPHYYQNAFYAKMNELCEDYQLPNSILKAAAIKLNINKR